MFRSSHLSQPYALVLHTGFQAVRLLLIQGSIIIKEIVEENKKVSKTLVCHIDALLKEHNLRLSDISYIATTTGPAPLTTLRSTLATINGIAAASNMPLFSLSTFEVWGLQPQLKRDQGTLVLLDAFSGEVHYVVYRNNDVIMQGIAALENVAHQLNELHLAQFFIVGEQAPQYKKQLEALVHTKEFLLDTENDISSTFLTKLAFQAFEKQQPSSQLFPIYLKPAVFGK